MPKFAIITKASGEIPKWLKGLAWKASRRVTACEGSNPSFSARKAKMVQCVHIEPFLLIRL